MPSPDERQAENCDSCGQKMIDTTAHYVGVKDRRRYHPECCDCAWRDYE